MEVGPLGGLERIGLARAPGGHAGGLVADGGLVHDAGLDALHPVVVPAQQFVVVGAPRAGAHVGVEVHLLGRLHPVEDVHLRLREEAEERAAHVAGHVDLVEALAHRPLPVVRAVVLVQHEVEEDGVLLGILQQVHQVRVLLQVRIGDGLVHHLLELFRIGVLLHPGADVVGRVAAAGRIGAGIEAVQEDVLHAAFILTVVVEVVREDLPRERCT